MSRVYPEYWPQFFTVTVLEWKPLLQTDTYKDEIIKSLQFLVQQKLKKYLITSLYPCAASLHNSAAVYPMRHHIHPGLQKPLGYKHRRVYVYRGV